ncbi:MAG: hypothetical protein H0X72_06865 [Acidobacteria bacterium]|nr:hypothetical protein [Acidobacteriota bacterium]
MKKFTISMSLALSVSLGLSAAACSSGTNTTTTNIASANKPAAHTSAANTVAVTNSAETKPADETPASVKAVFPDAQSFTKQHKDIPKDAIADIEKDSGAKVPDTDHHSYLAFSTTGGARKQIGAATVVTAGGKEMVVVYDNKNGSPIIKEVRADGVPAPFLAQFAGKSHDDKFTFGSTIKANGVDEAAAKAITSAITVDVMTMQALYGAAHSH